MVIFELPEIMDSDPVDMFVLYYNILISMKGQLNVNVNVAWNGFIDGHSLHVATSELCNR